MIGGLAREAAKRLTATCEGQDLGGQSPPSPPSSATLGDNAATQVDQG